MAFLQAGALLAAVLIAGCATMDREPVPGWPALRVVQHFVPHAQMRERCARYVGFGMSPEACAEFDFANGQCHLWFSSDFPPSAAVLEHERLHCAGHDHRGERTLQRLLTRRLAALGGAAP